MERIADIHGHYVFGVDDGSTSLEMSRKMIEAAYKQGVRHIFCTSHDNADANLYKKNFNILQECLNERGIDVTLHMGREIYCEERYLDEVIEKLESGQILPMGTSKYVLLEFAPWASYEEIVECIVRMRTETDFEPIIAHMERCLWLHDEPQIFDIVREMKIPVQINAYSLVEASSENIRTFARKLLQEKVVTFIGSDTHGTGYRPVKLTNGVQCIYDNCDIDYAEDICYRNAEKMLI